MWQKQKNTYNRKSWFPEEIYKTDIFLSKSWKNDREKTSEIKIGEVKADTTDSTEIKLIKKGMMDNYIPTNRY